MKKFTCIFGILILFTILDFISGNTKAAASGSNTVQEARSWYTALDEINTLTKGKPQYSATVQIAVAYSKDDQAAFDELTEKKKDIEDFLTKFLSKKTFEDLQSQNDEALRKEICNEINKRILKNCQIKDVRFLKRDLLQQ